MTKVERTRPLPVIMTCDCTAGVPGRDIDDALALLYLRGVPERVRLLAACATHGNGTTTVTYGALCRLSERFAPGLAVVRGADGPMPAVELDYEGRPVVASSPSRANESARADIATSAPTPPVLLETTPCSDAARYIADSLAASPGRVALLATGATTDLALAECLRPGTLRRARAISLMGGITHTLLVGGRIMDELNLSADHESTCVVLGATAGHGPYVGSDGFLRFPRFIFPGNPRAGDVADSNASRSHPTVLIADAWSCLDVALDAERLVSFLEGVGPRARAFAHEAVVPWADHLRWHWGPGGFVCWDALAAVALAEPELVTLEEFDVALDPRMLSVGLLERAQDDGIPRSRVSLVHVADPAELCAHLCDAWARALGGD